MLWDITLLIGWLVGRLNGMSGCCAVVRWRPHVGMTVVCACGWLIGWMIDGFGWLIELLVGRSVGRLVG